MGEKGNVAESQMALALFQLKKGTRSKRRARCGRPGRNFGKRGSGTMRSSPTSLLARILLSQGQVADAEKETSAVHDLLAKSQDFSVRLRASIAEAQVEAAAGKTGGCASDSPGQQSRAQGSLDMWDISWRRSSRWAKLRWHRARLLQG